MPAARNLTPVAGVRAQIYSVPKNQPDIMIVGLNDRAPRYMGVLNPLRVVIENYPQDASEELEALNHPTDESFGTRRIPFGKVLYIERDDFREDPPKKFFRLGPGRERFVNLRGLSDVGHNLQAGHRQ